LVEGAPGDIEFRAFAGFEADRTGGRFGAWPKRLNAPLMWFRDILFFASRIVRGQVWGGQQHGSPDPVGINADRHYKPG